MEKPQEEQIQVDETIEEIIEEEEPIKPLPYQITKERGYDCGEYENEFDENGNIIKHTQFDSNGAVYSWTEYEYDSNENLEKQIDFILEGSVIGHHEYEYDSNDNQIKDTWYKSDSSVEWWYENEYDGNGNLLQVVTFEEMLDVIKDKEKLFIELKGISADQKTADDLIAIIEEKDCKDDVVFISLNYDIIDYIETNYPEYETGTLFFIGIGDISRLNCDLLIMEEEIATDTRISSIHDAGKKAIVWTVNTSDGLYHFLDSRIDAIITDEIILAEEVQEKLDNRNDLQVIKDKFSDFWD